MASFSSHDRRRSLENLRWPLRLTQAGMVAERLLRCFWPFLTLVLGAIGLLMLGVQDILPLEVLWTGAVVLVSAVLAFLVVGIRGFQWPRPSEALLRLDATLPGRPIQALMDKAAIGADDADAMGVWRAHQARMAAQAKQAKPVQPELNVSRYDPFALRYAAILVFLVALLFGSFWKIGTITNMSAGGALANGPTWEGWVEPPRYTGQPTVYLNDITAPTLNVVQGSVITLRLYGEIGALAVTATLSKPSPEQSTDRPEKSSALSQDFIVSQSGRLNIEGSGGRSWDVVMMPDTPPSVAISGDAEASAIGEMTLPFIAKDDFSVERGFAHIALDLEAVDRRFGLEIAPDARDPILVPLPTPVAGDRRDFSENLVDDFSLHPFANLPVVITLSVQDALEQEFKAEPKAMILPGRRFFDPLAAAIIEQRRDLLWARSNAPRVAQLLRVISYRPDDIFRSETAYLRLRVILRRIEAMSGYRLSTIQQDEIAQALWDLAIVLEEGDLGDALERLRRAQERLSEAMKNGASDQEIAELMQKLREASNDYMRQLSRQAQQDGSQNGDRQSAENSMTLTQDDLQAMMDRIQELMEQGRMAEAEQALQEYQEMMENMRITQGQNGQSEGDQAMEGLADTLRQQQGLSDQAFRDLQEQFNPGAQAGESQNNEGGNGGQGRGESHNGQNGQAQGDGNQPGQEGQGAQGQGGLANRQQALRQELSRQRGNLPGAGTAEGDAAREALGRAGNAMEGAEEALRDDDYAAAIDQQSEAMEALREGMRSLGEAMAQDQQNQSGQGSSENDRQAQSRDPLGRQAGANGSATTDEGLLQGEDVYRRARDLLEEIRRRSGDVDRPEIELDYLKRLLDRF